MHEKFLLLFFDYLIIKGEPITASQYFGAGRVTEFKYGINIGNNKNSIHVCGFKC